jgi:hypothetical protein
MGHRLPPGGNGERAGLTLTWVAGYRRSHKGRDNAPFIRSITHAPDQTYIRLKFLQCLFDLATPSRYELSAEAYAIFMGFRGPKALFNLHGWAVLR